MKKSKVLKRVVSSALAVCMVVGLNSFAIGCKGNNNSEKGESKVEWVTRDENQTVSASEYTQTTYLPKAEAPSTEISCIDLRQSGNTDIMLGVVLQGLINRQSPSIWVLSNPLQEGEDTTGYWLDKLDESYPGTYTKAEYTDLYELVADNADKLEGYILYSERLCDSKMRSRNYYSALYGDMACLDLTIMLASQHNAIPLTAKQVKTLKDDYGVTLAIKGDTTYFMEKDTDGNILNTDLARASRTTWKKVFEYVANKLSGSLNKKAFAHNPAFEIASADYWVQNNMLVYSRILDRDATSEEKELEDRLLAITDTNAVSVGVWYLQNDEGGYVAKLTHSNKTMVVTYETYNLSWTSGLESVYAETVETRDLEPEAGKIYVSFDLSEGDNVSYESFRLNKIMDAPSSESIMGWTFSPTLGEIAPNMQKYYNTRVGDAYSVVTPEQGVAYVSSTPSHREFYAATAEYLNRSGSDTVRILSNNAVSALPYAEKLDGLNGVFVGYMGEGEKYWNNNEDANFLYNGTAYFRHYDGRSMSDLGNYNSGSPAFFAVGLYGWGQSGDSVEAITKNLDDRFVVVTPSELAELYKKYKSAQFENITSADFATDMSTNEMGFLNYASSHTDISTSDGIRYADGENYLIYKFDLDDAVSQASARIKLSGRYRVECSVNKTDWAVLDVADKYYDTAEFKTYDLSSYIAGTSNKTVYIRIGDATEENDNGAVVSRIQITTDKAVASELSLDTDNDGMYLTDDASNVTYEGRNGSFTYKLPLAANLNGVELSVSKAAGTKVEISTDGSAYTELSFDYSSAKTDIADITDYVGNGGKTLYLRFSGGTLYGLKLTPIQTVGEVSFSPSGTSYERKFALSLDDSSVVAASTTSSYRLIEKNNKLIYKFRLAEGVNSVRLDLNIRGTYRVSVSKDGKNYTDAVVASLSGTQVQYVYTDITALAEGGKDLYVRVSLIDEKGEKSVRLYGVRLMTNLSSASMIQRYENERLPDISVSTMWDGTNRDGNIDYGNENTSSFEYKLIDWELTSGATVYMHNHVQPLRTLTTSTACWVYKLDFSAENMDFWKTEYPDLFGAGFELTDLKLGLDIAEGYKIEVSADGENWTTEIVAGVDDTYTGGASNRTIEKLYLKDYLAGGNKTVYIRFSDNTPSTGWGALLFGMDIYLN